MCDCNGKVYRLAELFCGPGGLALGARQAKVVGCDGTEYVIRPVWANDVDPYACDTYRRNIHPDGGGMVVCARVEDIDLSAIPEFDALAFGFPCNTFSQVGEQRGIEDERYGQLYSYGVAAIEEHDPLWFIAENVTGLKSANNGRAFNQILAELERAGRGYRLTAHMYCFEDYGVPQVRHRIVIVGLRRDLGRTFRVPAPTTFGSPRTAREALEDPPIPKSAGNQERTRQSKTVIERLRHIPPGENAWYEGVPEHLRLNVKGAFISQIYRRLHPDRPAYTVTGSGGGGTHMYHWEEPRALTNRERARLQTFPDDFFFEGPKEAVRKQIGMAVPPLGARLILEAVLKTLAGVQYETVPASLVEHD